MAVACGLCATDADTTAEIVVGGLQTRNTAQTPTARNAPAETRGLAQLLRQPRRTTPRASLAARLAPPARQQPSARRLPTTTTRTRRHLTTPTRTRRRASIALEALEVAINVERTGTVTEAVIQSITTQSARLMAVTAATPTRHSVTAVVHSAHVWIPLHLTMATRTTAQATTRSHRLPTTTTRIRRQPTIPTRTRRRLSMPLEMAISA
jgi:hypothetical protein